MKRASKTQQLKVIVPPNLLPLLRRLAVDEIVLLSNRGQAPGGERVGERRREITET